MLLKRHLHWTGQKSSVVVAFFHCYLVFQLLSLGGGWGGGRLIELGDILQIPATKGGGGLIRGGLNRVFTVN